MFIFINCFTNDDVVTYKEAEELTWHLTCIEIRWSKQLRCEKMKGCEWLCVTFVNSQLDVHVFDWVSDWLIDGLIDWLYCVGWSGLEYWNLKHTC